MSSVNHDDFAHLKIPLGSILSATNNFDEENFWGKSNLGNHYTGQLLWSGELTKIHVQRWNKEWDEKEEEFWKEISMLSSLKHKNVASLVGFCDDNDEKITIYKLENRSSLRNYLSDPMSLTWVRRLEISVGIAHALSYIHYDESRDFSVIHRFITSGTVLLNDDWEPKLASFGRSMAIKTSKRHSTFMENNTVNHKSDIYSFGIVLFELLCGRKSIINIDSNKYLAPLAVTHYKEKRLDEIIDWDLLNQMDSQSFDIFAEIAYGCLNEERSQRPNIDEIVTRLEKALELQLEHQTEIMNLRIPLENILFATNNFALQNFWGETGFDKRYEGQLLWSGELIDINAQRLNKERKQVEQWFWTEISMLSSLKHKNVVSFVGFCDDNDEKVIITRRETRLSLKNYLSGPMWWTWVRRLEISVGVAHALSYIHYDEPRDFSVIHRKLCSATVLLNDDWEPKLSDFEISMKIKASERHHSFHTNKLEFVKGYGDPTYIETNIVNHKSDIYSFGIVLFELLCGRRSIIDDQDNKYLVPVVLFHHREKILNDIIDPILWKQMDPQSLKLFVETAHDCLNEERSERPSIDEIVPRLEKALELQLEHENASNEHSIVAADTASTHQKGKSLEHLKIGFKDIELATENFAEKYCIGSGGYGKVYKAQLEHFDSSNWSLIEGVSKCDLPKRRSTVAIKHIFNPEGKQCWSNVYSS